MWTLRRRCGAFIPFIGPRAELHRRFGGAFHPAPRPAPLLTFHFPLPPFCRWHDTSRYLLGLSCIGVLAVPSILFHAGIISAGAFWVEAASLVVLGGSAGAYYIYATRASSSYDSGW